MRLHVFASGSTANGYLLYNDREALVIEAGVPVSKVVRFLKGNTGIIAGCLLTHEHQDHAKYVRQYMLRAININTSKGTADKLDLRDAGRINICRNWEIFSTGRFTVRPFNVHHDAAEPFGYFIHHPECGNVLFATDTYYLDHSVSSGLNQIMIECNYSRDLLDKNYQAKKIHPIVRNRTLKSHMEHKICLEAIMSNNLHDVANIVLLHLSSNNADPDMYVNSVIERSGKRVFLARKGLDIDFNINPCFNG